MKKMNRTSILGHAPENTTTYPKCETVRPGVPCLFWKIRKISDKKKKGHCSFIGGKCLPIVEECGTCNYIVNIGPQKFSEAYMKPSTQWIVPPCPMNTHIIKDTKEEKQIFDPRKLAKLKKKGLK